MKVSFERVYEEYKDMVYNYVFWKVKNEEDALDLTQDIFFKVYKGLRNFREESSLKTWVMKIAVNHVKDFYRKKFRRDSEYFEDFNEEDEEDSKIPEIFVEEDEIHDRSLVERALERLKDWEREIIVLYYMEGFQYDEIAGILGIPMGTVKSRLNSAKKSLRKLIYGEVKDGK